MKKTNKLAKRVLSVLLALSIVLSFAISVSAIPTDYTIIGEAKLYDFEDGDVSIFKKSGFSIAGSVEASEDMAFVGTKSAKLTVNANNLVKFWPNVAFEKNSTYVLSYYYYSDFTAGINTTGWNTDGIASYKLTNIPQTKSKWNKTIVTITTGDDAVTNFALCYYNIGAGATVYIDNVEFAKVDGFTGKSATLPKGASATTSIRDFEDGKTTIKAGYANFTDSSSDKDVVAASVGVKAHYGNASLEVKGLKADATSATLYMVAEHTFQPSEGVINANRQFASAGIYYMSYYAYTDAEGISTDVSLNNGYAMTPSTALEAGKWTKVSGVYEVSEEFAAKANSGLFRLNFSGLGDKVAYVDDILLARINMVEPAMLYDVNAEYNSADNTAVVTATSTVALKSATISASEGVTASDVVISEDGTEVTFNVSGLTSNTTYELTANISDVFGSAAASVPVVFTTPMTIAASSIADGATGVLAPVDYVLIDTPTAVVESTVTADKFTLEGAEFASVTGVTVADGRIKVELDGIYGAETYTLKVDGVEATNGAILKDSITFTTRASEYGNANATFEDIKVDEETGAYPSVTGAVSSGHGTLKCEYSTEKALSGNLSVKMYPHATNTYWGGYTGLWINGMRIGKTYKVTFNYYSDTWNAQRNNNEPIVSPSYGIVTDEPVFSSYEKGQWNKVEFIYTPNANAGGALLQLREVGQHADGGCVYFDNVQVQEIGTISNPVMFNDGAIVNTIAAGTTNITLATATDMTGSIAYAVQYDANNKMIQAVPATIEADAITFAVTSTDAVKTKLIIMDGTSYAPVINYIQFN